MREDWLMLIAELKSRFTSMVEEVRIPGEYSTDVPIFYVKKEGILDVLQYLKTVSGSGYEFLSDITATDEMGGEEKTHRFEVVYQLFSHQRKSRIRVKVRVKENEEVPTAVHLWNAANWAEREVWDMFGIRFSGHPNMRRILMDSRWKGHPLRKDYPLRGYQIFPTPEEPDPKLLE